MNTETTDASAAQAGPGRAGQLSAYIALGIIPLNCVIWFLAADSSGSSGDALLGLFTLLALAQLVLGIVAVVAGVRARRAQAKGGVRLAILGLLAALGAPAGWFLGMLGMALGSMGGAWGRPLRIRGRLLHPSLREGSDWTRGQRPDTSQLDVATRRALEALWLHDAQKEHASVPAFSRLSWLLAATGAPAELMEWAHRAALEEIEHTRLCFALAAGYGGRSHTVQPMPELLLGGLGLEGGDALITLATESLSDGCQLEDFNADVAAECARGCEEPVTRGVLEQIAREERSHADFSWALVTWLLERDRARVQPALEEALARLEEYPRPTAVSWDKRALVDAADPALLRAHGRLPDARWAALWELRLTETRQRVRTLLGAVAAAA